MYRAIKSYYILAMSTVYANELLLGANSKKTTKLLIKVELQDEGRCSRDE